MDQRVKDLLKQGDQLFSKRGNLLNLWQEQAEQFYPERADFTVSRALGDEFASNLDTSYPILARRDMADAFATMLRPKDKVWAKMGVDREDREDDAAKRWLEDKNKVMRRAMYDPDALFTRATNEGDNDYATFGQAVISCELNRNKDTLLHRCHHLRDVAWCENSEGKIGTVHRKWKPSARILSQVFKEIHPTVRTALKDDPYREISCRHVVVRAEDYEKTKWRQPFISVWLDVENEFMLNETGIWNPFYAIPRWKTVAGSQYAFSPATVAALPEARAIQGMAYALLTAGEILVNPPMIGVQESIKGAIELFPGGFTAVDAQYDERLGEVLRPAFENSRGVPVTMDLLRDSRQILSECFYLDRLTPLPNTRNPEMTAYEAGQRIQAYVRKALPLFEPMEADYNGQICDIDFDLLMRGGAFGSPYDIPDSIKGSNIRFTFTNPLREAEEKVKGQVFMETKALIAEAMPLDPMAVHMVDPLKALRDTLHGVGTPADWIRSEDDMDAIRKGQEQKQQMDEMLGTMERGAQVTEQVGKASKVMAEAGKVSSETPAL